MSQRTAIIIGAGPAGLTAAYELLERSDIHPVIIEGSSELGGISRTINYRGNRIDIGGHRFFSKSDRVMDWWFRILPPQDLLVDERFPAESEAGSGRRPTPDPESTDRVLMKRRRVSRIFFLRSFFDYPVSLSVRTALNLGPVRMVRILFSYVYASLFPIHHEKSLEDFFINRFGRELYETFFKDYTEKVWGVPCNRIKPEWGAQRIKGLSILATLLHAVRSLFRRDASAHQKKSETSLIEVFLYPKYGPGQMWETVADMVKSRGAEIHFNRTVDRVELREGRVVSVGSRDVQTGERIDTPVDIVFSTMPIKDLVAAMGTAAPPEVRRVAEGLIYRDFITVGLLLKKLTLKARSRVASHNQAVPDNWIYIQERDVRIGRLQIFNNWSPYMVRDPGTVWLGLEYFCNEGDDLWTMPDAPLAEFAASELEKIQIIDSRDVLDRTVIRQPKAYPAYFGTYDEFSVIKTWMNRIPNLFLVGRNGMHKYNNSDHSMLSAMVAVDNIVDGIASKENLWEVNTETEYHEEKKAEKS